MGKLHKIKKEISVAIKNNVYPAYLRHAGRLYKFYDGDIWHSSFRNAHDKFIKKWIGIYLSGLGLTDEGLAKGQKKAEAGNSATRQ